MKIQRIFAENVRLATAELRRTLGPDAVILSNKRVGGGVELVAAIDYDQQLFEEIEQQGHDSSIPGPVDSNPHPAMEPALAHDEASGPLVGTGSQDSGKRIVWAQDPLLSSMQREMREMRSLLENGLSGLAWSSYRRTTPKIAELLGRLMDFGMRPALSSLLVDELAGDGSAEISESRVAEWLAGRLRASSDNVLEDGGVVAMVGPTGVGKTTTVAKIAARYTLTHGPGKVALITTDSHRIGAVEQLRTFGRILGMPVQLARDAHELNKALDQFSTRKLVLIDTAGMSPRDIHVAEQIALLRSAEARVRSYLVLAANAQLAALEETTAAFRKVRPSGCIITKLDEAQRLGGVLSVVIDADLPVAFTGNGQRVPEDLQRADVESLVAQGWQMLSRADRTVGQEAMALTFGSKVVHAYA